MSKRCLCQKPDGAPRCAVCPLLTAEEITARDAAVHRRLMEHIEMARTAVCEECKATNLERRTFNPETLQWEPGEHGTREWRYFERSTGSPHVCSGTPPAEPNGSSLARDDETMRDLINGRNEVVRHWVKELASEVAQGFLTDASHTPADLNESKVRKLAGEMAREVFKQERALMGPAQTVSHDMVRTAIDSVLTEMLPDTVAATVQLSKRGIRDIVKSAVDELVPHRHEIVLLDTDGAEVRKFDGTPHVEFENALALAQLRMHVMLIGPAGGGKTTAADHIAKAMGLRYFEKSMGPQTSQWDLVGFVRPDGGYSEGWLYEPYKNGGVAMIDEMDNSNAAILTVLNSALSNGHYTFPNGERVARHPDFVLVASGNTYGRGADRVYVGRQPLDGATLDRFAVLDWEYDETAERNWATGDDDTYDWWVDRVQSLRHRAFALKMRVVISPRASINGVKLLKSNRFGQSKIEDMLIWKGISKEDRAKIEAQS